MKTSIRLLAALALFGLLESNSVLCQQMATEGIETAAENTEATTSEEPESPATASTQDKETVEVETEAAAPVQSGPLIDLFGPELYSLQLIDETSAQLASNYTNEALAGKSVVGVYFSADWCGTCGWQSKSSRETCYV